VMLENRAWITIAIIELKRINFRVFDRACKAKIHKVYQDDVFGF